MSNNPSLININNLNINENNKNTITINDSIYLHDAIIIYPYVYNNVHYDFIYDSNNKIEYDKDGLAKFSATITDGVSDIIIKDNITYYDKDSNKKLIGVVSVVNITLTTNTQCTLSKSCIYFNQIIAFKHKFLNFFCCCATFFIV